MHSSVPPYFIAKNILLVGQIKTEGILGRLRQREFPCLGLSRQGNFELGFLSLVCRLKSSYHQCDPFSSFILTYPSIHTGDIHCFMIFTSKMFVIYPQAKFTWFSHMYLLLGLLMSKGGSSKRTRGQWQHEVKTFKCRLERWNIGNPLFSHQLSLCCGWGWAALCRWTSWSCHSSLPHFLAVAATPSWRQKDKYLHVFRPKPALQDRMAKHSTLQHTKESRLDSRPTLCVWHKHTKCRDFVLLKGQDKARLF